MASTGEYIDLHELATLRHELSLPAQGTSTEEGATGVPHQPNEKEFVGACSSCGADEPRCLKCDKPYCMNCDPFCAK